MGASTYSSSYSGKGSTSVTRSTSSTERTTRKTKSKSSMREMLELLEKVERCREVVADKQADLDTAKRDLEKAEQKVSDQINKLDPETKARFRRMMGGFEKSDDQDQER